MLQLVDEKLAILFFLDQAACILPVLRGNRTIMVQAPDREAAYAPEDDEQNHARRIGAGVAKIDHEAEQAAHDRGEDADAHSADRGRNEDGRNIGREENVGPDLGKAPAKKRRKGEADCREADAEGERRLRYPLPAAP